MVSWPSGRRRRAHPALREPGRSALRLHHRTTCRRPARHLDRRRRQPDAVHAFLPRAGLGAGRAAHDQGDDGLPELSDCGKIYGAVQRASKARSRFKDRCSGPHREVTPRNNRSRGLTHRRNLMTTALAPSHGTIPGRFSKWTQLAALAFAVVVLMALSFVLGRATIDRTPRTTPAAVSKGTSSTIAPELGCPHPGFVLNSDPSEKPTGRPPHMTLAQANLVGRTSELERLEGLFDEVAGGRTLAVMVAGDAGIESPGWWRSSATGFGYAPASSQRGCACPLKAACPMRRCSESCESSNASSAVRREPAVCCAASGSMPPSASSICRWGASSRRSPRRRQVPTPKRRCSKRCSRRSPISRKRRRCCSFSKSAWADSASSDLFDYLIRNLGDARVLVLGTCRDEEFGPDHPLASWLAELMRHARVSRLGLGGLDRRSSPS